jgi:hypothetical protein
MAPDGSPLAVLAQQGAEVVNLIVADKSANALRGNLLSAIMIKQGVPEVKLHLQLDQVAI